MRHVTIVIIVCIFGARIVSQDVQLTSTNSDTLSLLTGFTARFQCTLYRCGSTSYPIAWFKNDIIIFNGTEFIASSGLDPANVVLQRSYYPEVQSGGDTCVTEEYTVLIKNLTLGDAGKYRCQLLDFPQQLDFRLDVLESGLESGFHENATYDFSECCVEKGISPLCQAMCKPQDMGLVFFDPTSCKTSDYKNFLNCATDNGKRNYVSCCRERSVPSFCYDFCSNDFQMLTKSHRLCLFYLPEIFGCFATAQAARNPSKPRLLSVKNNINSPELCWNQKNKIEGDLSFSVHLKEIPPISLHGNVSIENKNNGHNIPTRSRRSGIIVMVATESTINSKIDFRDLPPENIHRKSDTDFCVDLVNLKPSTHYIAYVQAANEYGMSEPSSPLFIRMNQP